MSWVKLDDNFHAHPKVLRVGLAGAGLFARALSYCACYETNGFVPREWVALQEEGQADLGRTLVHAGLWEPIEDGYRIQDYLDYNPSREQLAAQREKDRAKKEQMRASSNVTKLSPRESSGNP